MHPVVRLPYSAAGQLARLAAAVAPPGGGKFLTSLRARRGIRARYARWGAQSRDRSRGLVWFHASSAGEGLQARAVMALLAAERPELQLAYTFYSPSAERLAQSAGADFIDYLPFDTAGDADAALDALAPSALVFSKLDVWPVLVARAAARGVPVALISATIAGESGRRSGLAGLLLGDAYRALTAVGAIAQADAERLIALGVARERMTITGDTRYDQVWARAHAGIASMAGAGGGAHSVGAAAGAIANTLSDDRPTLVAGSTWPADEAALLEAWREVRARVGPCRLIIAPHEPTEAHLAPIEQWAEREHVTLLRLGAAERSVAPPAAEVILVDRVGALGDLYALADIAYVGGGFHGAGLHSVIEPAAFGVPVIFGPRHSASADAARLLETGGGFSANSAPELAMAITSLFTDETARTAAGDRARAVVESGLGAAAHSSELVQGLLAGRSVPSSRQLSDS